MVLVAAHHGVARPGGAPVHDGVVQQHEAVGRAELERGFDVADDLVPDDVPGAAVLWLEADAVVHGVVNAVAPDPHVRAAVVASMPSSDVSKMSLPKMSTFVSGYEMPSATLVMRLCATVWPHGAVQLDAFAVEAFGGVRRVADDRVVGDVPVRPALLQVDAVVIVVERAAPDDHIVRCGDGEGAYDWFRTVRPSSQTWLAATSMPFIRTSPSPDALHAT